MCPRFWSRLLPLPGEAIRDFIGRCRHPFSGFHVVVTTDDVIIIFSVGSAFCCCCVAPLEVRRLALPMCVPSIANLDRRLFSRKDSSPPLKTFCHCWLTMYWQIVWHCMDTFFLSPNWLLLNCQTSTSPLRMKLCLLCLCESASGITGVRTRLIHRGGSMGF